MEVMVAVSTTVGTKGKEIILVMLVMLVMLVIIMATWILWWRI